MKNIEKFSELEDEGGQELRVPVWILDSGKITFMTFYVVVYESNGKSCFLTNREARF